MLRPRCRQCGYDTRGLESHACPECGAAIEAELARFTDRDSFNDAMELLHEAGVITYVDQRMPTHDIVTGAQIGPVGKETELGGQVNPFWSGLIIVKRADLDRAKSIIQDVLADAPRPIVDRAEPQCPSCDSQLDPFGRSECPACGLKFDWVEIEEAPIDRSATNCLECGYALTGSVSEYCPECGMPLPRSVEPTSPAPPRVSESFRPKVLRWIGIGISAGVLGLLIVVWNTLEWAELIVIALVGLVIAFLLLTVELWRRIRAGSK